jgi:hypothetical protein
MSNIYYNPEEFGLKTVAEIEYSDACYQFDIRVVWKELKGSKCYTMRDSGCSCPIPFEDYNMSNIDPLDFDVLRREVNREVALGNYYLTSEQGQEFLEKVRLAKRLAKRKQ